MDRHELRDRVAALAERFEVPGVAVGVLHGDDEHYAFHGVTSIENPLPVDEHTLFQYGSTGKTYTATAIMRLVERGALDLDERVRTYVPELALRDEDVAREVTLLQLLNHTAGWDGGREIDTGDGDDVRLVYHGGTTNGQLSEFVMVPERGFAVASLTNSAPNGEEFNAEVVRLTLEAYAGVIDRDPEPVELEVDELQAYVGRFETVAAVIDVSVRGAGLLMGVEIKPEALATMVEEGEEAPDEPPIPAGMLGGDGDGYIVTDGPYKGMKGYFTRDAEGHVDAVHVGGRLATRIGSPSAG